MGTPGPQDGLRDAAVQRLQCEGRKVAAVLSLVRPYAERRSGLRRISRIRAAVTSSMG
jgi:hypothetical protein